MPKVVGLSFKQQRFVDEYIVDGNASRAAKVAGFSERGAMRYGSELLTKPEVRKAIAAAVKAQQKRTLITADQNLKSIERLARKAEGASEYAAAIRARELIGKHHRSFSDKVELTGANDGPVEFTEIRRTIVRPTQAKP